MEPAKNNFDDDKCYICKRAVDIYSRSAKHIRDGEFVHKVCLYQRFCPYCEGILDIRDNDWVNAQGDYWHQDCFYDELGMNDSIDDGDTQDTG